MAQPALTVVLTDEISRQAVSQIVTACGCEKDNTHFIDYPEHSMSEPMYIPYAETIVREKYSYSNLILTNSRLLQSAFRCMVAEGQLKCQDVAFWFMEITAQGEYHYTYAEIYPDGMLNTATQPNWVWKNDPAMNVTVRLLKAQKLHRGQSYV